MAHKDPVGEQVVWVLPRASKLRVASAGVNIIGWSLNYLSFTPQA